MNKPLEVQHQRRAGGGWEDGGGPGEEPEAGNGRAEAAASPGECGCQRRAAERKESALNKGIEAEASHSHSPVWGRNAGSSLTFNTRTVPP